VDILRSFNGEIEPNDQVAVPEAYQANILVSTINTIGPGVTLTRASRLVLIEPTFRLREEQQAIARIRRVGQKADRTYTYKLVNVDSPIEMQLVER
jgi:hypothetical protein